MADGQLQLSLQGLLALFVANMTINARTIINAHAGAERLALITDSFVRLTGKPLIESGRDMWNNPAVILAHGTQAPPLFFYGNCAALTLFAMSPAQLIDLPSHRSAEPERREERANMLGRLESENIIHDYSGIRIAADGTRFRISNATVWNLMGGRGEERGQCQGQAAIFSDWEKL